LKTKSEIDLINKQKSITKISKSTIKKKKTMCLCFLNIVVHKVIKTILIDGCILRKKYKQINKLKADKKKFVFIVD
jgi:hypothetical protein